MKNRLSLTLILFLFSRIIYGSNDSIVDKPCSIGSSMFMLANFIPNPPKFYQLTFGYKFTPKDVFYLQAVTWSYSSPLGIQFGKDFDAPEHAYPGSIQDFGMGLIYQRFIWKGWYSSIEALALKHNYLDKKNVKIQSGFQLFMTLRTGYHIPIYKNNFYMEPSIAFTHWPINSNVPESFAAKESPWPNYFLFEPGLNFGFKF